MCPFVRARLKLPIVLAHESCPELGGCAFSRVFDTTPQDLKDIGLYKKLATPFVGGVHREVSLALFAKELGAVSAGRRALTWSTCSPMRSLTLFKQNASQLLRSRTEARHVSVRGSQQGGGAKGDSSTQDSVVDMNATGTVPDPPRRQTSRSSGVSINSLAFELLARAPPKFARGRDRGEHSTELLDAGSDSAASWGSSNQTEVASECWRERAVTDVDDGRGIGIGQLDINELAFDLLARGPPKFKRGQLRSGLIEVFEPGSGTSCADGGSAAASGATDGDDADCALKV